MPPSQRRRVSAAAAAAAATVAIASPLVLYPTTVESFSAGVSRSGGPLSRFPPASASSSSSSSSSSSTTALYAEGLQTLRDYMKFSDEGVERMRDHRIKGETISSEVESGTRPMPDWYYEDFVEEQDELVVDENVIVAEEWGQWDDRDLEGPPIEGEWDAILDPDPNVLDTENYEYVSEIPKDDDGVELGYDPIFGSWYPVDERTIVNPSESFIIDEKTANATSVPRDFPDDDDPEVGFNSDFKAFRRSLKVVETYVDEWTGLEHPRHVAKWRGHPLLDVYPKKDWMNNRFTKAEDKTDFDSLDPHRARKKAIELARSKNNEWLPKGVSFEYHRDKTSGFEELGLLVGSMKEGPKDPEVVDRIRPALDVLGNVVELLSIQGTVFRFKYHGLIKNRRGMEAWTRTLIADDCGVDCTGVVFETGRRKRDPWYDYGDHWHGPY